jgi:hypothetical protein
MSYWPGLQITLEHVFESATGIPFVWNDEPIKVMKKPYGVLALGQSITLGRDSSRYTFSHSDTTIDLVGYRELTINVQVFSRQSGGDVSARALIEKARLCLANPVFQNRKENRSAFDVVFRLVLNEQLSTDSTGYFDTIAVSENFL